MGVEDKRKTEQLPLEGERSFPGTAVRSPNYALDWGMEGSSTPQGHCLVTVEVVSIFNSNNKIGIFFSHSLEQCFLASREVTPRPGTFDNVWSRI